MFMHRTLLNSNVTGENIESPYALFKAHYYNGINMLKTLPGHNLVHTRLIVNGTHGDISNIERCSFPLEYITENVVYFKYWKDEIYSAEKTGLDFSSFVCDYYTFMKFTSIYKSLKLIGNDYDYNSWDDYNYVIRQLCATYCLQFYYEDDWRE